MVTLFSLPLLHDMIMADLTGHVQMYGRVQKKFRLTQNLFKNRLCSKL